ncbi:hypothetical protein [Mesorhizobium sp. CAU 1741]|uniref:hypothetical protein n=1 Tax=Mesorhizobium sp. CAU 1741 TaxID=3140366 RepID=UPI00325B10C4
MRMLFLLLCACVAGSGPAAADALTNRQIETHLVGKQIAWWEAQGWRHGYLMLLPNGSAEMTVDRPDRQRDVGRWTLRGDEICTLWGEVRGGVEKCYRIRRESGGLFVTSGGNVFEVRELGV